MNSIEIYILIFFFLSILFLLWLSRKLFKKLPQDDRIKLISELWIGVFLLIVSSLATYIMTNKPTVDYVESYRPYLEPKLVIDLLQPERIHYHIDVENKGKLPARGLKYQLISERFIDVEMMDTPIQRDLAPNATTSLRPVPLLIDSTAGDSFLSLIIILSFQATVENQDRDYQSRFRFLIPKEMLTPGTYFYQYANHADAIPHGVKSNLEELSFKSLELPEGTTFFVLPEVNEDNEPNIVSITSKNRSFNFNPITRVVTFNSVIHGGKEISLTRQIRPRKIHIINLMWNDNGALLNIDKDEVAEPPGFGK